MTETVYIPPNTKLLSENWDIEYYHIIFKCFTKEINQGYLEIQILFKESWWYWLFSVSYNFSNLDELLSQTQYIKYRGACSIFYQVDGYFYGSWFEVGDYFSPPLEEDNVIPGREGDSLVLEKCSKYFFPRQQT